jgi:nucleoside-diphosphate-sugar epimerase
MTSKGVVLVTGANGFIAARTVEAFLKAGYSVRGTVRSKVTGEGLVQAISTIPAAGKFELVEVPDITVAGAFDEAVKGVTAVAHLASPVSFFYTDPDYVIGTAVKGTRSILDSAIKESGIKNFVLMSSVAAIRNTGAKPRVYTEADWNDQDPSLVTEQGSKASGAVIYCASKAQAEREFWKFRKERQPSFTMTAINPV